MNDIRQQLQATRSRVASTLGEIDSRIAAQAPRARMVTGLMLVAIAALGIGVIVAQRRRHRLSLAERLHGAVPASLREMPEEVAEMLKQPMQRVRLRVQ